MSLVNVTSGAGVAGAWATMLTPIVADAASSRLNKPRRRGRRFLTMPISWKGTLAQYVGRLHREHHAKREVVVYDYVDSGVPMLARMALKRQSGYRSLGYEVAAR